MGFKKALKLFRELKPTFRHLIPAALEIYLTPEKQKFHKTLEKLKVEKIFIYVCWISSALSPWFFVVGYFIESKVTMLVGVGLFVPLSAFLSCGFGLGIKKDELALISIIAAFVGGWLLIIGIILKSNLMTAIGAVIIIPLALFRFIFSTDEEL